MDMTVEEYLKFVCEIKEVRRKSQKAHLDDLYNLVKITDVRHRLIRNLSKGYKQRVGVAQALVGNPEVVIMDEPTVGLDPKQIIEIRKLISGLGENHTVVLSSHILHEVADVCDRVVIINKGQIVAQDTLANLTHGIGESIRLSGRKSLSPGCCERSPASNMWRPWAAARQTAWITSSRAIPRPMCAVRWSTRCWPAAIRC